MPVTRVNAADNGSALLRGVGRVVMQANNPWQVVIPAGGMTEFDGASNGTAIATPENIIADAKSSYRKLLIVEGNGAYMAVRAAYNSANSLTTDPIIQVFGRFNSADLWEPLRNRNQGVPDTGLTVADASTDIIVGSYKYTDVDDYEDVFDLRGCREIVIGIKTIAAGTNVALAHLLAKVY